MQAAYVQIKVKERLNKLDSADYDNIECWQIREAFNKAQLEWIRRQIHGKNQTHEGDESTDQRVDDLQQLLAPAKIFVNDYKTYFETRDLPTNYLHLKRCTPYASKGKCKGKQIKSTLREEANVDEYLQDWSMQPSFEFEETFHTMINNSIRIYTNKEFSVDYVKIIYYRFPQLIDFTGCVHLDGSTGVQTDPELRDDIVELIIDDAVSILAGDIESPNQFQLTKERSELNN
jgi:hypothetical protein